MASRLQIAYTDLLTVRQKNIEVIKSIPVKLLTVIPDGFSNNIYWQAGHILTVQDSLIYRRCGLDMHLDQSYLTYFAKGTSPKDFDAGIPAIEMLFQQSERTLNQLKTDLDRFARIPYPEPVEVSFGLTLNSFSDAVCALPFHEAYHLGTMNLLKKFLK